MNADPITLTGHLHPGTEEGTPPLLLLDLDATWKITRV